jgi:tRNA(fMet)-specific endonuclease VapC
VKRILLDTSAYASFFSGDERVLDALAEAETVYLSTIVLGELLAGFRGGNRPQENKAQPSEFLDKPTVHTLDVGKETAEVLAQVIHTLSQAGIPIPMNDVWIASQAIETGSVVVTLDQHFKKVPGLRLWDVIA